MRCGMRRDHRHVALVGLTQDGMTLFAEVKVSQPVVNEVDPLASTAQGIRRELEIRRISNQDAKPGALEQVPVQDELRVEVLALRIVIDDRDGVQLRRIATGEAPLLPELRNDA